MRIERFNSLTYYKYTKEISITSIFSVLMFNNFIIHKYALI